MLLAVALVSLLGCGDNYVETTAEVDNAILANDYDKACLGVKSEDLELRKYSAEQLAKHPDVQAANQCVCTALYDKDAGKIDPKVAEGLKKTKRDDLATCLAAALSDPKVPEKSEVAKLVSAIQAPKGYDALADLVKTGADAQTRSAAATGLQYDDQHLPALIAALGDADASVRKAAAASLANRKTPDVSAALAKTATSDADPDVRVAAIVSAVTLEDPSADDAVCAALMSDAEPVVRQAAAAAFKNVRRPGAIACLSKRAVTQEDNEDVRKQTLASLASTGAKEANQALCDDIGPYVRLYVKDALPEEDSPLDIAKVQNDVDFEKSYECVQKAMGQSGYSCYGKYHLATWFTALGGKAAAHKCPGMPKEPGSGGGGGGGGGGEVSFE